jgi:hypothetical protein
MFYSLFFPSLYAQVGLSVSPPRVYYSLGAGQSGVQQISVNNTSKSHALDLSITFGDWKYDENGNNVLLPPDSLYSSCAAWLSLPEGTYLTLEPGESRNIELIMTVPSGIKAENNVQSSMLYVTQMNPVDGVDTRGAAIRINVRQGIKIYRKGLQPDQKLLEIVNMSLDRTNNTIGVDFLNKGNIWVNGILSATLFNRTTGKEVSLAEIDFYTMPGDHRKVPISIQELLEKGDYTATVTLNFGDETTLEVAELEFSHE